MSKLKKLRLISITFFLILLNGCSEQNVEELKIDDSISKFEELSNGDTYIKSRANNGGRPLTWNYNKNIEPKNSSLNLQSAVSNLGRNLFGTSGTITNSFLNREMEIISPERPLNLSFDYHLPESDKNRDFSQALFLMDPSITNELGILNGFLLFRHENEARFVTGGNSFGRTSIPLNGHIDFIQTKEPKIDRWNTFNLYLNGTRVLEDRTLYLDFQALIIDLTKNVSISNIDFSVGSIISPEYRQTFYFSSKSDIRIPVKWDPSFFYNDSRVKISLFQKGSKTPFLNFETNNDGEWIYTAGKLAKSGFINLKISSTKDSSITDQIDFTVITKGGDDFDLRLQ